MNTVVADIDQNESSTLAWGAVIAGGERSEGENHGNAKLTGENVRELRSLYADGATLRELADKFGVSNVSIYNAVSGRTWRHLD